MKPAFRLSMQSFNLRGLPSPLSLCHLPAGRVSKPLSSVHRPNTSRGRRAGPDSLAYGQISIGAVVKGPSFAPVAAARPAVELRSGGVGSVLGLV